jgi:hypothetical protein
MSKAGWKERIQQAFIAVHGDKRDSEQVRASRQMVEELSQPVEPPLETVRKRIAGEFARVHDDLAKCLREETKPAVEESRLLKTEYGEQQERVFCTRAKYLSRAALRSGHVHYRTLRRDLHHCYVAEAPTETVAELFAQALRQLEGK